MIYLIIGGSCCGKTSFVKNTWLKGHSFENKKDILPYVETKSVFLLGKYNNIEGRERAGSDTISRSQISLIVKQVKNLLNGKKDVVLEGDKVTSRKILEQLLQISDVTLILIYCDHETSLERNRALSSIAKPSTLKASLTKAKNIYVEYKDKMDGFSIDTTLFKVEDFQNFSLYNYRDYIKQGGNNKLF